MYTEIEAQVRKILKGEAGHLTSIDSIGLEDDISDFGITSVNYIKLLVLIESEFEFEIKNEDLIYENFNTIHKIVTYIEQRMKCA